MTRDYDLIVVAAASPSLRRPLRRVRGARPARLQGIGARLLELARAGRHRRGARADDAPELHAQDTFAAGRGLCRPSAVRVLTEEAPARIVDLADFGVRFDEELGLEGGHSRRRVSSVGGAATGQEVSRVLARAVLANPRIDVSEGERALELWLEDGRCVGLVTDTRRIRARAVVLATGGYAALWGRTTNPPGSVGEGIAMAYRAGAAVADLEFVQFHRPRSRARRCCSAKRCAATARCWSTTTATGSRGARAARRRRPRDQGARQRAARPAPHGPHALPALMQQLVDEGFRPDAEPVPVAPAAHYTMGGVHGSRRRDRRAGPLRRRRVRVHGRPRREPAGGRTRCWSPGVRPARVHCGPLGSVGDSVRCQPPGPSAKTRCPSPPSCARISGRRPD